MAEIMLQRMTESTCEHSMILNMRRIFSPHISLDTHITLHRASTALRSSTLALYTVPSSSRLLYSLFALWKAFSAILTIIGRYCPMMPFCTRLWSLITLSSYIWSSISASLPPQMSSISRSRWSSGFLLSSTLSALAWSAEFDRSF